VLATAATSLSIVLGLALGLCASTSWWWRGTDPRARTAPLVWVVLRTLIALMRSVHELLWAILFLAAFGLTEVAAVIAIAIPYGGTLAKIYSELLDEVPRDTGAALRGAGATGLQTFCFGVLPRALPDMAAYTFYRFECALRASAVLGFFGVPTLGLYIRQSFASSNFGEVWTYLYALIALVVVFDAWSGALRRRFVA
jgi:phosphonate transport system permease protein